MVSSARLRTRQLTDHGLWPREGTRLLLRAALLGDQVAFAAWRAGAPTPGTLGAEDWRLLPLLDERLEGEYALRAARVRARAEAGNALLLRGAGEAVRALADGGIEVMALKGLPLLLEHYRSPGLRPMSDVDLLVRPGDLPRAMVTLVRAGFAHRPIPAGFLRYVCAVDLARTDGVNIDLHQYLIEYGSSPAADEGLWRRAHPLELPGATCLAPSATDLLLHVCLASLKAGRMLNSRWIVDACTILRGTAIDWELLVEEARRRRSILPLRECLQLLAGELAAPVPARVLDELWALPVSHAERTRYRVLTRETRTRPTAKRLVEQYLSLYAFGAEASGARRTPWGFVDFVSGLLADRWELPDRRRVPAALVRRLIERLRS